MAIHLFTQLLPAKSFSGWQDHAGQHTPRDRTRVENGEPSALWQVLRKPDRLGVEIDITVSSDHKLMASRDGLMCEIGFVHTLRKELEKLEGQLLAKIVSEMADSLLAKQIGQLIKEGHAW